MSEKLQVEGLTKSLGHQAVLRGITFTANKGDVIVLLGSSGSGKSTLLRCLDLLIYPDAGTIKVNTDVFHFDAAQKFHRPKASQVRELRKKVGMVFQQFNLWAHMTVLENLIEAPIHVLGQTKKATIEQAQTLLKKVGLSDKQDCYPEQLSGGQQQRAAIARALMMKPEIMLFDEPTSALDPENVGEVLNVMQALAAEGMTMLIATHEMQFARKVANRVLFLDQGMIVEQGPSKELFESPQTERFKRFLQALHH